MIAPDQIAQDPAVFSQVFLSILTKDKRLVPFEWNGVQKDLHSNFTGRDLVLKSRQVGITTLVQAEIYRQAVTKTIAALTLANTDDATQKIRLMADRFHENCKFNEIQPARKYANASLTTYLDYGSEVEIGTAGSLEVGRGSTYTLLHGTEVAFWPDAEKIVAGAMQGGNPDVILESTPNGAQGYFFELCMDALAGRGPWRLHFYPWWKLPEYAIPVLDGEELTLTDEERALVDKHNLTVEQIKWRRNKKGELKAKFAQEYPEDPVSCFLVSGDGYFGSILADAFSEPAATCRSYNPDHVYTAGLDFGQSADFTYMPVFDRTDDVQVDFLHVNKLSWKEQRRRIKSMNDKWHCVSVLGEANSIGSVNIELLRGDGINIHSFWTDNTSKELLISNYYDRIENGTKLMDWGVQRAEHYNFVSTQLPSNKWRLAAKGDGHDDTVLGNALAVAAPVDIAETTYIQPEQDVLMEMDNAF